MIYIAIMMITFPGVIIHEIAHKFFCDIFGIKVNKVKYFIISEKIQGYVSTDPIKNLKHQYLVSVGPFIINTLFCSLLTFPYALTYLWFGQCNIEEDQIHQMIFYAMAWVGFSSGMHAFPSNTDLDHIERVNVHYPSKSHLFCITVKITLVIFRFFNLIQFFFIEFFYALAISAILPSLLSKFIP